ncbi:MAG: YfcE family phosphodiesterase [Clostridiales bacterium]|nr:YfcE family phosphodiesterase [Clostridiales bacterium]
MKKRIVAFSDSHGAREQLERAIEQAYAAGRVDELLFLGDGVREWEQVTGHLPYQYPQAACRHVLGNNDFGCLGQEDILFEVNGVRIYACHGHWVGVKTSLTRLMFKAMQGQASVAFYGHTHVAAIEEANGITTVCPGSVRDTYRRNACAYAELLVEESGSFHVRLVPWE